MKKIFTIAAAFLASLTMFAQTLTLSEVTPESNWYGEDGLGRVTNKSGNGFSSPDMTCEGSTGYKTGSSYFTIQTYQQISGITVWARSTSNRKIKALTVSADLKSSAQSASNVEFELTGGNATYAIPKNTCDNEFTVTFNEAVAADSYIQIVLDGNAEIVAVTFIGGTPSTDPILNVSKAEVDLALTAAKTSDEAIVKFSGKNLKPGTYNLVVPNLAGLTVTPTAVTVGADGKLNAEVTIAYASTVDVAAGNTSLTLTIGELSAAVAINYSAVMTKQYITNSFNIEQLVMANGKGYNIKAAFDAAHIEYSNLDALDSLNNGKGAGRNEAYLGLKIKKTGGFIACWLPAGQTIRVKFGYVENKVNAIAGSDTIVLNPTNKTLDVLEFTALADTYVKIQTTSDKTVVLKQIKLNEAITDVLYKIAYNIGEGGTVTGWTVALPGEDVVMDITSNEGFALTNITYNGTAMVQTAPGAPISFTMPAEAVTIVASFGDVATAIDNTEEAVKTVKFFENGQLIIMKNGVKYNAQGACL